MVGGVLGEHWGNMAIDLQDVDVDNFVLPLVWGQIDSRVVEVE